MKRLHRLFQHGPRSVTSRWSGRGSRVVAVIALGALVAVAAAGCGMTEVSAAGSDPSTPYSAPPSPVSSASSTVVPASVPASIEDQPQLTATPHPDSATLPDPVTTLRAESLGQYAADALLDAGFIELEVTEALETTLPDTTVTDITLAPKAAGAKGSVFITVFTNPNDTLASFADWESDTDSDPVVDEMAAAIRLRTEKIALPGTTEAYLTTGPLDSRCQLVAQLPNRTVINILSSSGELEGGVLPLDRQGVEKLASLLVQKLQ